MPIVVIGLSHHSAPVTVRERFAFAEARVPVALQLLKDSGTIHEGVILSTCNRVEIYVSTSLPPARVFPELRQFLVTCHDYRDPLTDEVYALDEPESLHHLFKVACGLDSMVLGETEILGQLKKAYETALNGGFTGGKLNKAFQRAFHVAKQIRTETNIQRGSVSVGSVAVELAQKVFTELEAKDVLVIGAGDTSEKTARALVSRGAARVFVTNRSQEKAAALAAELGGRALAWDTWPEEFPHIDIIISSTSAPGYILDAAKLGPLMKLRLNQPLLLIDIAVPRDIDPDLNFMDDVYLYNIDDLQAIADDYLKQRKEEVARCEQIILDKARALLSPRVERGSERGHSCASPGALAGTGGQECPRSESQPPKLSHARPVAHLPLRNEFRD
jgi:glutamyl-tRNA reductase